MSLPDLGKCVSKFINTLRMLPGSSEELTLQRLIVKYPYRQDLRLKLRAVQKAQKEMFKRKKK